MLLINSSNSHSIPNKMMCVFALKNIMHLLTFLLPKKCANFLFIQLWVYFQLNKKFSEINSMVTYCIFNSDKFEEKGCRNFHY